jgi:quinol monooxygenase YgiN
MAKFALYAELKAKAGKESEVAAFLKQGAEMAKAEKGTIHWYAFKEDKGGVFGIFDTFEEEAGREAHLNGPIAKALMEKAGELLSEPPRIHKIELIGEK